METLICSAETLIFSTEKLRWDVLFLQKLSLSLSSLPSYHHLFCLLIDRPLDGTVGQRYTFALDSLLAGLLHNGVFVDLVRGRTQDEERAVLQHQLQPAHRPLMLELEAASLTKAGCQHTRSLDPVGSLIVMPANMVALVLAIAHEMVTPLDRGEHIAHLQRGRRERLHHRITHLRCRGIVAVLRSNISRDVPHKDLVTRKWHEIPTWLLELKERAGARDVVALKLFPKSFVVRVRLLVGEEVGKVEAVVGIQLNSS